LDDEPAADVDTDRYPGPADVEMGLGELEEFDVPAADSHAFPFDLEANVNYDIDMGLGNFGTGVL
jgi:hypothetical protein